MPSDSWLNGWVTGDVVTAAEFGKSGGAFFDSIAAGAVASFDITSVPTWGTTIRILLHGRGDTVATSTNVQVRFNNDTAANYATQRLSGNTTTASSSETNTATSIVAGTIAAASAPAQVPGSSEIVIPNFRTAAFIKSTITTWTWANGLATTNHTTGIDGGVWSGVNITRITIFPAAGNFVLGTRCTAYVVGP
jgi:hypothetical protein